MTASDPSSSSGNSWLKPVGFGCLVLLVLGVIGIVFVARNLTSITARIGERALVSAVEDLGLPDTDEAAFVSEIRELSRAYRDGEITEAQIAEIVERVTEDDLLTTGAALRAFRSNALASSGLDDDEMAAATRVCQRLARGLAEGRLDSRALSRIRDSTGDMHDRRVSDAEIRTFIASLAEEADAAGIPDEPYEIDFGARFREVVSEAVEATPDDPMTNR